MRCFLRHRIESGQKFSLYGASNVTQAAGCLFVIEKHSILPAYHPTKLQPEAAPTRGGGGGCFRHNFIPAQLWQQLPSLGKRGVLPASHFSLKSVRLLCFAPKRAKHNPIVQVALLQLWNQLLATPATCEAL